METEPGIDLNPWGKKLEMGCGFDSGLPKSMVGACGSCPACRQARYNERFYGGPLDYPGTEAYFNSIMGSLRREAAKRRAPVATPRILKFKGRVIRRGFEELSPQMCGRCGRVQGPGTEVWTDPLGPWVACLECAAVAKKRDETGAPWYYLDKRYTFVKAKIGTEPEVK